MHYDLWTLITWFFAAVVGIAGFITACRYLWFKVVLPLRERAATRRTLRREAAFLKFSFDWLIEHADTPMFILDEEQRCVYVNPALRKTLQIDSSGIEGRKWHRLLKESELSRVLAKWDEAYRRQSSYTNVSIIMVGGRVEKRFKVTGEPFVYRGRVRNFIGTIEPFDTIDG